MARTASPRRAPSGTGPVARRAVAVVLLAALLAGWWLLLRPSFVADGPVQLINVHGKSMEPGLHTGDVAVVYRRDSYQRGDVVAYRSGRTSETTGAVSGPFIIHRITGGDGTAGYLLRGDNTSADDPWSPTYEDVAGEMLFSVPGVAGAVDWLSRPVHAGGLLAGVFVALVLGAGPRRPTHDRARPDTEAAADRELVS